MIIICTYSYLLLFYVLLLLSYGTTSSRNAAAVPLIAACSLYGRTVILSFAYRFVRYQFICRRNNNNNNVRCVHCTISSGDCSGLSRNHHFYWILIRVLLVSVGPFWNHAATTTTTVPRRSGPSIRRVSPVIITMHCRSNSICLYHNCIVRHMAFLLLCSTATAVEIERTER